MSAAAQAAAEQIHLGPAHDAVEQTFQETAQTDTPGPEKAVLKHIFPGVAQALKKGATQTAVEQILQI